MRAFTRFRMPQRTVRFTIRPDGGVVVLVVFGCACQQLTERLEAALGTVERRESTSDAFQQPQHLDQTLSAQLP